MTLEEAVHHFTQAEPRGRRKLVAVSGGRDSVALLCALHGAGHRNLVVCHLNHRLRGRQATGDARFVRRLGEKLGLPVEVESCDVKLAARRDGESLELAGRKARRAFFLECARKHRCRTVVLAHHAGDQAETLLFNLLRGAGGLRGIRQVSLLTGLPGRPVRLVRPLLDVSRQEIDAWLLARGIAYREDATNSELQQVRNRLRHEVIPLLNAVMQRDVGPQLCRAWEIAAADEDWLEQLTGPMTLDGELDVAQLRARPLAAQRRVIHAWLRNRGAPGVSFDAVERVRGMLEAARGPSGVTLAGGRLVRRSKGKLRAQW